jgi:hypothetical protein
MKTILILLLVVALLAVVALGIILAVSTPRDWPMSSGTIKAKKVLVNGQSFVMVEGEPMNYLGQIQSISVEFDNAGKHLVVSRCLIRWNPFSKIVVNNQWPVFYPLADVKPGKYSVVYESSEGEQTAGTFEVP